MGDKDDRNKDADNLKKNLGILSTNIKFYKILNIK